MTYQIEIKPSCLDDIKKHCKKNHVLEDILRKKMEKVVENPYHFKPLKHDLAGERRVHIMKSFVLRYEVDEAKKAVIFLFFGHHDEAYQR